MGSATIDAGSMQLGINNALPATTILIDDSTVDHDTFAQQLRIQMLLNDRDKCQNNVKLAIQATINPFDIDIFLLKLLTNVLIKVRGVFPLFCKTQVLELHKICNI